MRLKLIKRQMYERAKLDLPAGPTQKCVRANSR